MRRVFLLALLMLPGCALLPSSGQRFVVFFPDSGVKLDDAAAQVVAAASDQAVAHPDRVVIVAGFADPSGTPAANAQVIRDRTTAVSEALAARGLPAARIQVRDAGQVEFALNSQESRRVVVTVGRP